VTYISAKYKIEKGKGDRSRMLIWDNYSEGKKDRHRHFEAICHYYNKGKWQYEKPSTIEAHLALYCKRPLIEVTKRGEKVNNKNKETPIRKKTKTANQSITSYYQYISQLSPQQSADITKALLKAF
ncbi:6143_t:CDS:2, partial [Scutellospora calospora]